MFYVNNDDMDELFRQAAEHYPLKTDGKADWEEMSAALRKKADDALADAGNFKKEKKRRVFFWWILLLPLGWIGHESWQKLNAPANEKNILSHQTQSPKASDAQSVTEKTVKKPLAEVDVNSARTNLNKTDDAVNADKKDAANVDEKAVVSSDKKINKALATRSDFDQRNEPNLSNKKSNKGKNIITVNRVKNNLSENSNTFLNKKEIASNKNENINNVAINDKNNNVDINDRNNNATAKDGLQKNSDETLKEQTDNNAPDLSNKINDASAKSQTGKLSEPLTKTDDKSLPVTTENNSKKAKRPVVIQKNFHFYAAIMAGADLSTVKFQSVKGVGNSFGLLLGYHFSHSKFNIETGVYWDTKKYYSSGEYFDKKNVDYFNGNPNIQLNSVNGTCNMFEIPVNVRYNISQTKKSTFFAVLGLSSYLMNKESYDYELSSYGASWPSDASYYHSTQNWFSIMNLSVGYEHRLGKIGDIRIEPYAKLPLSGVGKGSLAITSAGLNVGISKRF